MAPKSIQERSKIDQKIDWKLDRFFDRFLVDVGSVWGRFWRPSGVPKSTRNRSKFDLQADRKQGQKKPPKKEVQVTRVMQAGGGGVP